MQIEFCNSISGWLLDDLGKFVKKDWGSCEFSYFETVAKDIALQRFMQVKFWNSISCRVVGCPWKFCEEKVVAHVICHILKW